jgi:CDP-glucose 4,6-dehydratase
VEGLVINHNRFLQSNMDTLFHDAFRHRRVLVTGHTGFKGAWLCEWLLNLGAEVHGYALDPLPHAVLFDQLRLHKRLAADHRADILDRQCLATVTRDLAPNLVFHLAAQPIVRLSYRQPVETFAVNVMGTIHMLDALRLSGQPCTAVMVTTDKCYENREWLHPYREEDPMGGHDPYSASKGAAEIAIAAWRRSFSHAPNAPVKIASARAGNVIGGGDWAPDRIVPDVIRAVLAGEPISVRNPHATRPWQHVLEPLSGYLKLAAAIYAKSQALPVAGTSPIADLCGGFNFGPTVYSNQPVGALVAALLSYTGGSWQSTSDPVAPHEAAKLHLATEKAFHLLGWRPVWSFEDTVRMTASWYIQLSAGADPGELTRSQIEDFVNTPKTAHLT